MSGFIINIPMDEVLRYIKSGYDFMKKEDLLFNPNLDFLVNKVLKCRIKPLLYLYVLFPYFQLRACFGT